MLSDRFLARLKTSPTPAYRLAAQAGVHPTWLSQVIRGARPVPVRDPRLLRIGQLLGVSPDDVFVEG